MPPPVLDYDTFTMVFPEHATDPGCLKDFGVDYEARKDSGTKKGKKRSSRKGATVTPIVPSYEGYLFTVVDPVRPGETVSWIRTRRAQVPIASEELYDKVIAYRKESGLGVSGQFQALGPNQQALVNRLIDEKNAAEENQHAVWKLFGVRKTYREHKAGLETWRINDAIRVTLRRSERTKTVVSDLSEDTILFEDFDKSNIVDLREPNMKEKPAPRRSPGKVDGRLTTGDAILHQNKRNPPRTAGRQDVQEYGDPSQNFPYVYEYASSGFLRLPQLVFVPGIKDRPLRDPHVHGDQQMEARPRSLSRARRSVDLDERRAREERKIADMIRNEVRSNERGIAADLWQTRSRSGSLRATRSALPEDLWSNTRSSSNERFSHSTSGTSSDRAEPYSYLERPTGNSYRQDPSGAEPYVDDRKRYHLERDRPYVVQPHDTYHERGREVRYLRDYRQSYDNYALAHQRRPSRERYLDRPRIRRRVTDYTEAFPDADFGRPTERSIDHERTRMYDREGRQVYAPEKRHGRRDSPSYMVRHSDVDVDPVGEISGVVASPIQTEASHSLGEQQNEPDVLTSPKTIVAAEEIIDPHETVDQHDLDCAGSISSPGLEVSPMINPTAGEKITPHEDFEDCDSDNAESVFSQASIASSMTSWGGNSAATGTTEMIDRIISTMFCTDKLQCFDLAILMDSGIGSETYRRNIRRMIKTFGMELRTEATSPVEFRAAVAMQTRSVSTHVARKIMVRAGGLRPRPEDFTNACEPTYEDQQSDASIESADEDDGTSNEGLEDEAKIRSFILDSNACLRFKTSLVDFVHKPYEGRILSAVSKSILRESRQDKISLMRIARELSWVPTNLFFFSHDRSLTTTDLIKGLIEDTMGESWDWSPLEQRKHCLQANHFRLSWRSPDGRTKHFDLPEQVEVPLRDAFNTAPAFVNTIISSGTNTTPANGSFAARATSNLNPTLPLPSYQPGGGTSIPPVTPRIPSQSFGVTTSGLQPHGPGLQGNADEHYVYLCVDAGTRHFIGVNCNGVQTDVEFFKEIKKSYDSARGWFRLWFSTWCYAHCDFWIFQQIALGGGARLEIGFPTPTDPLYHYLPKPLDTPQLPPHGPISHDEFNLHYYHQVCPSLLSWERWHRRKIGLSLVEKGALDVAPKRIIKLDMQSGGREKFYGLYAKEARSTLRVAIHMTICCLPGVIFFFLWLYQWGHGADLQGAAVPVQLSLTLVAGYLGVLYWTR